MAKPTANTKTTHNVTTIHGATTRFPASSASWAAALCSVKSAPGISLISLELLPLRPPSKRRSGHPSRPTGPDDEHYELVRSIGAHLDSEHSGEHVNRFCIASRSTACLRSSAVTASTESRQPTVRPGRDASRGREGTRDDPEEHHISTTSCSTACGCVRIATRRHRYSRTSPRIAFARRSVGLAEMLACRRSHRVR